MSSSAAGRSEYRERAWLAQQAAAKLGLQRGLKEAVLRREILRRHPDAPQAFSRRDLFRWFVSEMPMAGGVAVRCEQPLGPPRKPWRLKSAVAIEREATLGACTPRQKKETEERATSLTDCLPRAASRDFLSSAAWRRLRMHVLIERGNRCECCGASPADGRTVINVDHIKPRRKYPELALTQSNLQVLCEACNHGKGNWNETDWRASSPKCEQNSGQSHSSDSSQGLTQCQPPSLARGATSVPASLNLKSVCSSGPVLSRRQALGLARVADMAPRLVRSQVG